jgi:hypothetical protein
MSSQAPDSPNEPGLAVPPPPERTATEIELPPEFCQRLVPKGPERLYFRARPFCAEAFVHDALTVEINLVRARRPRHETADAAPFLRSRLCPLGNPLAQHDQRVNRIANESASSSARCPYSFRRRPHNQGSGVARRRRNHGRLASRRMLPTVRDRSVLCLDARASAPATRGAAKCVPHTNLITGP